MQLTRKSFMEMMGASSLAQAPRTRVVLAGTGSRGTGTWGRDLMRAHGDRLELVGLHDINPKRLGIGKRIIGVEAPTFVDFAHMIRQTRPELVIVATKDSTHHEIIVRALELGCDVITEKPMTIDEDKCRQILDAEKRTGKKVTVAFNYRYAPTAEKLKSLLMAGTIGAVHSVDFHWYLDTSHGADYFRRWHALRANSGTLFVHKSTHHFDLINWYLDADPVEVSSFADLKRFGRNGRFRSVRCRGCPHKDQCPYYMDITRNKNLTELYVQAEDADGYLRDACVFRPEIDIFDTMTALVKYSNGALMSYSVHCGLPIEGYHLAFNGAGGRIEIRQYERQPWPVPPGQDEIRVTRNFGASEVLTVQHGRGGHFGGDERLKRMLFVPGTPDPLGQRAGSRAGALSLLTGVAAVRSADSGRTVRIADLLRL